MKIAILSTIENYTWAGTEEVWYQFASLALDEGHDVMLAAHEKVSFSTQVKKLTQKGLKVSSRNPFKPIRVYLLKERFFPSHKSVVDFNPDILIINSGSLFDIVNLPYLNSFFNCLDIKKVFFCHFVADTLLAHTNWAIKGFFSKVDKVIFVSLHNRLLAERQLAYSFDNSEVIPNSSKVVLNSPLLWPDSSIINFACVARFETLWKGHDVLLQVLSQEKWRTRKWHLNLYGEGPDRDYIQRLVIHYRLQNYVTIQGYKSDVVDIWSINHVNLLASRGEGMPLAVLESMMCGRPTVSTDVGGIREIIGHGRTGWIADMASFYSYDDALETAWNNKTEWQQMGVNAHLKAVEMSELDPPQKLLKTVHCMLNSK